MREQIDDAPRGHEGVFVLAVSMAGGVLGSLLGLASLGHFFWVYSNAVVTFSFFGGALFGVPAGLAAALCVRGVFARLCVAGAAAFFVVAFISSIAFRPIIEGIGC